MMLDMHADDTWNVLETVEEYLQSQNWQFMRPSDEEIYVQIKGQSGNYKLYFMWDDAYASLQFCCELDLDLPASRHADACVLMADINARMWLGHFDITRDEEGTYRPCFRYTSLHRGGCGESCSQAVDDLVQFAVQECDRTRAAFALLTNEGSDAAATDSDLMFLALSSPVGRS